MQTLVNTEVSLQVYSYIMNTSDSRKAATMLIMNTKMLQYSINLSCSTLTQQCIALLKILQIHIV